LDLIVQKGSIAIDGISLTVAKLEPARFAVSVIPRTGEETTLLSKKVGDKVNLENDIVGKYVQRLFGLAGNSGGGNRSSESSSSAITEEFLRERGF
jgi:riboflavin synthase